MSFWKRNTVAAFIALSVGGAALAHKGATGIVKERMDGMVAMKDAMAVIGGMVRGRTEADYGIAREATETLLRHGKAVSELFPNTEESRQKASEATSAVWETPEDFISKNDAFLDSVEQLRSVIDAADKDSLSSAFSSVGESCSACHEIYRRKK